VPTQTAAKSDKTAKKSKDSGALSVADGAPEVLNPKDFLPYLINQITVRMNVLFKADLKKHRMSHSHWTVLAILARRGPLSLTEISLSAVIDQPSLSRIIDQMVDRDLVKREPRENDARFLSISLTPHGLRRYVELSQVARQHGVELEADLQPKELQQLRGYLRRILHKLED